MQKKYYSKFTASKETKKNGSAASSVARNAKSSYDDKPDDIGEIPWLIAKGATEGWSNEKFQTEFKRAQSSINVPRTRQYTDAARDDLVSWLSPDKYSDLEAKASNTYIPAQFGQRMLDNERMREYAERYQNTYIPATLAQDAIHRSGTGNDFNALTDNALRSEFLRKLDTKSMQDELDALNNDLDSNKQQYNRTKAQYASYGNNTSDNGARAAKRYIDDYEAKQKRAAELERDIYDASGYQERSRFESMRQNQDFAEKSSVSSSKVAKLDLLSPSTWNDSDEKYDFINDINGYRKKLAGENPGHYSAYESAYGMMSNDEVSLYNYVYATEGKDAADRYLSLIEEDLNRREGMRQAELIDGKPVAEVLYMLPSGLDSWVSGAKQNFSRNPLPVTSFQFGSELVREDLSERGTVAQVAGDIAYSVGNMAPSIIVSSMLGGAGIGELAGAATLGLGARGNAYANALREGYSYTEASNYATLTGASEAALQYLIGGVGKLGGKVTGNVIAKSIRNIDNALIRVVLKLGGNMLSEGSEEYLQSILEPVYRNLCFNENNEFHLVTEDAAYSFLLGALTAGLLEGGSDIYGGINGSRNGNAILSSGKYAALLDSAIALGEKSEAAKIAQELRDGKIHANSSNVGELLSAYLNEGGDITSIIPSEQNTAEAQSAEEILRNGARAVAERETARMNANAAENVVQQNTAQIQPVTLDNANSVSNTNDTRKTAETSVATSDTATHRTVEHRSASESASSLRSAIERSMDSVSGLDVYSDEDGSVTVSRNGSVLAEMDAREASAMASSYDSETNAIDYIGGFHAAYQLASEGMTINQITDTSILASDLTRAQLQAAYDSGRNASIESKRAAALDPKASGFKAGVNRIDQSTNLSRKQRSQIRILDAIGKKYGVEIIVDNGVHYSENGTMMSRSDANGFYNPSTGRIHINLNAVGEAYLAVGMHELVHHVKNFNESGYNTLESVVLGALEERGENVDALVKYQMEHFGYSESQAREEVVANSIPAILNDEAYVRKLVETDRTLSERIRDFLSDFVEFINETLRALEGEASWKQMRSLREDMDMLSTIAELFDTALKGAGETVDSDGYVRPSDASSTSDIINDTADGIIEMPKLKWSAKTLNEKQLKDSLSQRQAQILGIPYSIEKVGRNGKTGVFATTMDVTEAVMKKNGYSASDVKTVRGFMKRVSDYLTKQAVNEYRFVGLDDINSAKIYIDRSTGKVLLSCRVKNGEYDVNFDFTKVCKKREAMQRFIDDLARSEGRNGGATMLDEINLSPENIFKMNTILKDAGYETACLGCFVEAKRYNIRSWAETIVSEWNDLVLQRNPNAVYFGFATGDTNVDKMSDAEISKLDEQLRKYNTDGTSSATERMPRLMDTSDGMLKLLRVSDLITTQGRTALHEFSSELESIVASRYGTASPKSVEAFTPYNSEIALLPDSKTVNGELMSMADYLLKIAGVRSQSFSDFIITHVLDHLQKTVDLAARGFTAHTYTKEIARAVLFGMSGEKINLSVMFDIDGNVRWEYAGLDADGNYIVGDSARASLIERITGKRPFTQSIDFNAAVELEHDPQYSKNCGIIGVGYSYNHILKMLRDNNIPYIIAYHRSGLPTVVATASNVGMATDYTSVQNTLQFKSGAQFSEVRAESDIPSYATWNASKKAKRSKLTFDLKAELAKTGDPQKAMKNFLSFMEENNLTPNVKKKVAGHGSFDLYGTLERTGSPKATADAYIAWCIENGSIPMLYEFAAEDNYWKFLFDFSVIDLATGETAPQQPVSIDWLSEMGVDRFVEMVDKYMKQYNEYRSNQFGSETKSSKYADTKEKVYNALKFSLKDASTVDVAAVERENSKLMKSLALAEDQVKLTRGHRVKEGYIGVLADKALRDYSSSYDSATLKDNLIKIFKFLAKAQKPNMSEVNSLGVGLMKAVLEKSNEFDADGYNAYSDVRSYLRSTSITLSEDQRAEAAVLSDTYGKYRSSLFGSVKLTNDGLQLDTAWQELSSMNSALFPPETNASDMPRVLAVAAEAIKRGNFYTNPYGYDLDAFAADAWSNILESYFKSQTFADVKQSEIDALNQKMRDERNAARNDAKAVEREIIRNAEQHAKEIAKRDKREAALRDQILLERVKRKNRPDGKELTPMQIASLDVSNLSSTPKLAPIDASSERGGKSKFAESVDKSQNVSDEVRNLIQNEDDIKYYAKIANNETLNEANYRLNSLGEAETLRWYDARPENATALDVAEGFILLKRYQDAGDYESAVAVITKLRQMGSRAGQTVQAYSILGRLTPEAMSVYAQKELDTLRDEMVKRFGSEWVDKRAEMFQLTPEEVEKIKNTITEASKLPDGRDKNVLIASIASDIEAKLPTNSGKVIKALARNFMLLNSRTMIRNVAGNAIMMPAYVVQDFIGAGIDKALSKKTGIRTTGFSLPSKEGLKAAAKGLYESYDDFRRDINTKQIENDRFEIGNGHAFKKYSAEQQKAASTLKRQGMRLSNALNMMDRITGFLLDAGDRPFFEYHFTNSINAQIRLNNATEPTAEMIEIATSEALMRTWQDDNAMTRAASKLRNMLNPKEGKSEFGFGTLVVPFTKTPANLVKALVDYSPAGLVNALARKARAYSYAVSKGTVTATMQKDFVTSLSKGITGTLIMLLSAVLANAGLITGGDDDEDKDLSAFKKNILGIAPYSVVIDGHSYTYDWAQPIGGLMAISADLVNNIKSGKSAVKGLNLDGETQEERSDFMKALGAGGNAILNALSAGGNVMFEQSFMRGIKNLFSENGVVDGIVNSLMSSTTQFIPTALGQIAQIADPYARASYESNNVLGTTGNKLKAKIPGMRNDLAPVVDVMGNDVLSNGGNNSAFNVLLNPSNTYSERTTEAALEIYRVYQETGVLSVVPRVAPYSLEYGETYKFTSHERAQYQRVAGQTNTEIVNQLLSSKSYAALSDDQRAAVLTDATQYANAIAKEDFLSSKGVTYDFGSLSWVVKARDAENVGLSAGDYMIARSASRGIEGIKDADGNTIKNSKGLQIMSAVYAIRGFDTLPEKQRLYLFESLGVGKDVRHWNKALVEQELAKMRR